MRGGTPIPTRFSPCEHEMVAWERTTALLRRSLRLAVERTLGRETDGEASYSPMPTERQARTSPQFRRPTFPPRPPHRMLVSSVEDLFKWYRVGSLLELDRKLSESSTFAMEVFDLEDFIEVQIDEHAARAEYPFTVADFHQVLADVERAAVEEEARE